MERVSGGRHRADVIPAEGVESLARLPEGLPAGLFAASDERLLYHGEVDHLSRGGHLLMDKFQKNVRNSLAYGISTALQKSINGLINVRDSRHVT